jgi:ABC-type Fe3+ transport system permease subunit
MSRPLVFVAALAFALSGLAPIACMMARIHTSDLCGVLDVRTSALLSRTVWTGAGAAALAFGLGMPFGFLVARTNVPGARVLRHLGLVPLFLPPVILAMTTSVLWTDVRGPTAVIVVLGVSTFPLVALFTARAFERIDARREEAALLAGGLRSALAMELPLVLPAALCGACFAFVLAINDFAVPDYVASIGKKYNVYADEVFASWQSVHAPGKAVAAALPLLALTFAALIPALWLRRRGSLATLDGDFQRPGPLELGAWRWPATTIAWLLVGVTGFLSIGRLGWEAGGGARGWSLAHLHGAFAHGIEVGRADGGGWLSVQQRSRAAADVEDLVQEIFVKAFSDKARLSFDGLRDYGPFLFTIARPSVLSASTCSDVRVIRSISLSVVRLMPAPPSSAVCDHGPTGAGRPSSTPATTATASTSSNRAGSASR